MGSVWPACAADSSVVGVVRVSVGFLLGNDVALTHDDVWSVVSPTVVDSGCYRIVKVKAVPTCDLCCGRARLDCVDEDVVVWS
jgi:hypothetical protein